MVKGVAEGWWYGWRGVLGVGNERIEVRRRLRSSWTSRAWFSS